ncbi:unnamed protein product [Schistosoma curassoni]|uniref:ADF-H domain-containing protein n=1 Tax=Schistosoma curassoni TaxID=6186 RepID=A0A183JCM0_9TREM|nr:unnamed protein product [Schistosoma curassoni]
MTLQSGIHGNNTLLVGLFIFKKIVLLMKIPSKGSWEDDFDVAMGKLLDASSPCYVFYRLDSVNSFGSDWIFICYVPESSDVRLKTIYAATKATVLKQFGDNLIKDDITINCVVGPIKKLWKVKLWLAYTQEKYVTTGLHSSYQTIGGVSFALSPDSRSVLKNFGSGECDYVQLVSLVNKTGTIKVTQVASCMPMLPTCM